MSCPKCGESLLCLFGTHVCPPCWEIWNDYNGETRADAHKFYSFSVTSAVEAWAAWEDNHSAEYGIVGGSEATVSASPVGGKEVRKYLVRGEALPHYTAHEVSRCP